MSDRVSGELWASRVHNLTPPGELGVTGTQISYLRSLGRPDADPQAYIRP